jgi:carbamoylphosphate synthase small subunit
MATEAKVLAVVGGQSVDERDLEQMLREDGAAAGCAVSF